MNAAFLKNGDLLAASLTRALAKGRVATALKRRAMVKRDAFLSDSATDGGEKAAFVSRSGPLAWTVHVVFDHSKAGDAKFAGHAIGGRLSSFHRRFDPDAN